MSSNSSLQGQEVRGQQVRRTRRGLRQLVRVSCSFTTWADASPLVLVSSATCVPASALSKCAYPLLQATACWSCVSGLQMGHASVQWCRPASRQAAIPPAPRTTTPSPLFSRQALPHELCQHHGSQQGEMEVTRQANCHVLGGAGLHLYVHMYVMHNTHVTSAKHR